MIHLKVELNEQVQSWLQDVCDGKDEQFMFSALKEVVERWNVPYLKLQADGYLDLGNKTIHLDDVSHNAQVLKDEADGKIVLGEKITEKIQGIYALIKTASSNIIISDINEWAKAVIIEKIIISKDEQDKKDLKSEENLIS